MRKQSVKKVTKADIILLAASKIEVHPFTLEDLVVAAWQINKEMFGLKGYSDLYPNNNIVACVLMGENGLVKHKRLIRVDNKYDLPRSLDKV